MCILPLGTGNDLSRVLGSGEGYTGDVDVAEILAQMRTARVTKLDRWVCIRCPKGYKFVCVYSLFQMVQIGQLGVLSLFQIVA